MALIDNIRNATDEELVALLNNGYKTKTAILTYFGVEKDSRARAMLVARLVNIPESAQLTNHWIGYTNEDVRVAVAASSCISDVLEKIGLVKHGDNFKTIRSLISKHNIDTSHFDQHESRLMKRAQIARTADNVFVENSTAGRGNLRGYVVRFNVLPDYRCELCGNNGYWNNKELKLQVDHRNGVNNDNRIENLRWICPNCHTQTETFGTQVKGKHI